MSIINDDELKEDVTIGVTEYLGRTLTSAELETYLDTTVLAGIVDVMFESLAFEIQTIANRIERESDDIPD